MTTAAWLVQATSRLMPSLVVGAAVALGGAPDTRAQQPGDAATLMAEARRVIEKNDPERVDATVEGMLEGARLIEKALTLGYPKKAEAFRMMGYAYSQAGFGTRDQERRVSYLMRSGDAYEKALALEPRDPAVVKGLVGVQLDDESVVRVLRKAIAAAPKNADALEMLGRKLLDGGPNGVHQTPAERAPEIEEGVALLKRAAAASRGPEASGRLSRIVGALESRGRARDAEELRRTYKVKRGPPQGE